MTKIIFSIPFTGKTPKGDNQTQEWFDFRAKIFQDYTLKSFKNQTDQNLFIWLQFRPQDRTNFTTLKIADFLKDSLLNYTMTFDGPIMMEDRATWHNHDLLERAKKSLETLKKTITFEEDYVISVGIDSDDMVDRKFVEILRNKTPKEHGAYYTKKGFVYDVVGRLADWHNPTSMSIYAITYPTKIFLDAEKHFKHQNGLSSHEQIPKLFDAELLPDNLYCATIHGDNISTVWNHPFMGREYFIDSDIKTILNNFL